MEKRGSLLQFEGEGCPSLLFVPIYQMVAQSTFPFWTPWSGCWRLPVRRQASVHQRWRDTFKLKKDSHWGFLAYGSPETGDGYRQAKRNAALVLAVAKTQTGEEFNEGMKKIIWTASMKFWFTIPWLRREKQLAIKSIPCTMKQEGLGKAQRKERYLKSGPIV